MDSIAILDKKFRPGISSKEISAAISDIAERINRDYREREITFVVVLNGAFMFATELIKEIKLSCRISFVKISSYNGTHANETIDSLIGLEKNLAGKNVIILEDIVDSGRTLDFVLSEIRKQNPASLKIVSLLYKPKAFRYQFLIDYCGFEIPNDFVVGFGLDYNGYGRNLTSIYTLFDS
jgi:hypoxanthine phosphoribosyltransferase